MKIKASTKLALKTKLNNNMLPIATGGDEVVVSGSPGPSKRTQGTITAVTTKNIIKPMTIHFVIFPI